MNACHHYLRYSSRRAAFQISIFEKYSRGAREQNLILMRSRVTRSKFNSGLYRNFDLIINRYRGIIGIDFELDYDIFFISAYQAVFSFENIKRLYRLERTL